MLKKILSMDVGVLLRTEISLLFQLSRNPASKSSMEVPNPLISLNVKRVLDSHTAWLTRLKGVIEGTNSEILDRNTIIAPDKCELGNWIHHKDTKPLWENTEYLQLCLTHKEFHKLAGRVLQEFSEGHTSSAMRILREDLRKSSDQIQLLLIRLHAQK